jgi:hypothetical protein
MEIRGPELPIRVRVLKEVARISNPRASRSPRQLPQLGVRAVFDLTDNFIFGYVSNLTIWKCNAGILYTGWYTLLP